MSETPTQINPVNPEEAGLAGQQGYDQSADRGYRPPFAERVAEFDTKLERGYLGAVDKLFGPDPSTSWLQRMRGTDGGAVTAAHDRGPDVDLPRQLDGGHDDDRDYAPHAAPEAAAASADDAPTQQLDAVRVPAGFYEPSAWERARRSPHFRTGVMAVGATVATAGMIAGLYAGGVRAESVFQPGDQDDKRVIVQHTPTANPNSPIIINPGPSAEAAVPAPAAPAPEATSAAASAAATAAEQAARDAAADTARGDTTNAGGDVIQDGGTRTDGGTATDAGTQTGGETGLRGGVDTVDDTRVTDTGDTSTGDTGRTETGTDTTDTTDGGLEQGGTDTAAGNDGGGESGTVTDSGDQTGRDTSGGLEAGDDSAADAGADGGTTARPQAGETDQTDQSN